MDALSEILRLTKLRSCVYFREDFSSPWGMAMETGPFAQFHMVVKGHCLMQRGGEKGHLSLFQGDIVIFPFGSAHCLSDALDSEKTSGVQVAKAIAKGENIFQGDGESTTLVCGHFEFDRDFSHPLIEELPEFIHLSATDRRQLSWLEMMTNGIIQETGSGKPGSDVVVERLAEVLFIQILRAYMIQQNHSSGYLAALRDPQISSALRLIHQKPQESWTIASIAKNIGMSRSSFAVRFKELVGFTPMGYVTNWRLEKARDLLKTTSLPINAICEQVGYMLDASFSKAFKRHFNQSPGAMRKSFGL